MIDYLFYKLYKIHQRGSLKDIPEFAAIITAGLLIYLNLFVVAGLLRKMDFLPRFFQSKNEVILFMLAFYTAFCFIYYYKGRYRNVIAKYENENETHSKKGTLAVSIYIFISILLFIVGASFRPGKL